MGPTHMVPCDTETLEGQDGRMFPPTLLGGTSLRTTCLDIYEEVLLTVTGKGLSLYFTENGKNPPTVFC